MKSKLFEPLILIYFFDSNLEVMGSKPILKEKSVARMIELKEEYDLYDICRTRNPFEK